MDQTGNFNQLTTSEQTTTPALEQKTDNFTKNPESYRELYNSSSLKKALAILIVGVVVITIMLAFCLYLFQIFTKTPNTTEQNRVSFLPNHGVTYSSPHPIQKNQKPVNDENKPEGLLNEPIQPISGGNVYQENIILIEEIGWSFILPQNMHAWGTLSKKVADFSETDYSSGTYICYSFSNKEASKTGTCFDPNLTVSLISVGSSVERDSLFTDNNTWSFENGKYFIGKDMANLELNPEIAEVKTLKSKQKVLIIHGSDKENENPHMQGNPGYPIRGENNIAAIISTENQKFPGVIVYSTLNNSFKKEDFLLFLESFSKN